MDTKEQPSIIIENGQGICKVGYAGNDEPTVQFPTIIGTSQNHSITNQKPYFVGRDAEIQNNSKLTLHSPISRGIITDIESMEKIWHHSFSNGLKVDSSQYNCLLTESLLNPPSIREQMSESMFETFQVPSLSIINEGPLSLYSSGRTTGVICNSGEGLTYTYPVYEGYPIHKGIQCVDFAGQDLTSYLQKLLEYDGIFFSPNEQHFIQEIKEKLCYVSLNFEAEKQSINKSLTLPDNQIITLQEQSYTCPELLFKPSQENKSFKGIHQLLFDSIIACEIDVRRDLYSNVIISGGSTMFLNFEERLRKEVQGLAPTAIKVRISNFPQRNWFVWIGCSIIASLSTFQSKWITKQEYEETGPQIIHKNAYS